VVVQELLLVILVQKQAVLQHQVKVMLVVIALMETIQHKVEQVVEVAQVQQELTERQAVQILEQQVV
jgi:hypothetical protein